MGDDKSRKADGSPPQPLTVVPPLPGADMNPPKRPVRTTAPYGANADLTAHPVGPIIERVREPTRRYKPDERLAGENDPPAERSPRIAPSGPARPGATTEPWIRPADRRPTGEHRPTTRDTGPPAPKRDSSPQRSVPLRESSGSRPVVAAPDPKPREATPPRSAVAPTASQPGSTRDRAGSIAWPLSGRGAPPARGSAAVPMDVRWRPDGFGVVDPADDGAHRPQARGSSSDASALEPRVAAQALRETLGPETIVRTLLRGVLWRSRYAAALAVQDGNAIGGEALGHRGLEPDLTGLVLPIAGVPAFRAAVSTGAPYVGPVQTGHASYDAALAQLGGVVPPIALVLPVSLGGRVIGLIYAHHMHAALSIHDVADVVPLAVEAGAALARTSPAGPSPASKEPNAPRAEISDVGSGRARTTGVHPRVVPRASTSPGAGSAASSVAETVRPIDDVLRAILEPGQPHGTAALSEAIRRAEETLAVLRVHFPGPIRTDLLPVWQTTPASQLGPLLGLMVALGKSCVPLLIELLSSQDHNRRGCAALVCREVRHPQLVYPLFARVFDAEPAVRDVAIAALDAYPRPEIGEALEQLRNALYGEPTRVRAAAYAIARLNDVQAIPGLIAATERDSATAEVARRVLVRMTGQDFATKNKKWLAWWQQNRTRQQVTWLIDGLVHDDEPVRRVAIEGLTRLTGESFGYRPDLPKRERAEARARWLAWWDDVGRHRTSSIPVPPADPGPRKPA